MAEVGKGKPPKHTQFKKGQSGNPGGKTSEQVAIERRNAETAMRIREKLLAAAEAKLGQLGNDAALEFIEAGMLKLLKDAEERGLGAPKQSVTVAMDLGTALDTLDDD